MTPGSGDILSNFCVRRLRPGLACWCILAYVLYSESLASINSKTLHILSSDQKSSTSRKLNSSISQIFYFFVWQSKQYSAEAMTKDAKLTYLILRFI